MNRTDLITLAESLGLLYPEPMDYSHPSQMRLISKLEKLAMECYDRGFASGWDEAKGAYEQPSKNSECKCCGGSGRMVRDADIGTDQECFACNGTGKQIE